MITAIYLWLFLTLAAFFLTVGFYKKQYSFILIAGILFIFTALNCFTGIVITDHVVNNTVENDSLNKVIITTYGYSHELMDSYLGNFFASFLLLLGIGIMGLALYFLFKQPAFETDDDNDDIQY